MHVEPAYELEKRVGQLGLNEYTHTMRKVYCFTYGTCSAARVALTATLLVLGNRAPTTTAAAAPTAPTRRARRLRRAGRGADRAAADLTGALAAGAGAAGRLGGPATVHGRAGHAVARHGRVNVD